MKGLYYQYYCNIPLWQSIEQILDILETIPKRNLGGEECFLCEGTGEVATKETNDIMLPCPCKNSEFWGEIKEERE